MTTSDSRCGVKLSTGRTIAYVSSSSFVFLPIDGRYFICLVLFDTSCRFACRILTVAAVGRATRALECWWDVTNFILQVRQLPCCWKKVICLLPWGRITQIHVARLLLSEIRIRSSKEFLKNLPPPSNSKGNCGYVTTGRAGSGKGFDGILF